MTAHLRQARTMLRRIRESSSMWAELELLVQKHGLPERSIMALFDAMVGLRVRNATYRAYFQDTPEEITEVTASRDLRTLVAADLLEAAGEKRGRHYVARPGLRSIFENTIRGRVREDDTDPFA